MSDVRKKLIVLSGGGTGGPSVVPLALAKAYRRLDPSAHFLFLGINEGFERKLFEADFQALAVDYLALPAGKWRRYFSFLNLLDIFKIIVAFFKALFLFYRVRPDLIISAGSFASVPVVWAGRLLKIHILIHQQDVRPGLANRLMAPWADRVSVAFAKSIDDYGARAILIGNPGDSSGISVADLLSVRKKFAINTDRPFLLVTGGGSGAVFLNKLFFATLPFLSADWQIIHQTGTGKGAGAPIRQDYQVVESIDHQDFLALLACADVVVARAGLGSLGELSLLAKPSILIPIPNSQQEDNAAYFQGKGAAIVLSQANLEAKELAAALQTLLADKAQRARLAENIKNIMPADAADKGAKIIKELLFP